MNNPRIIAIAISVFFSLVGIASSAQQPESFMDQVRLTYNFEPKDIPNNQLPEKAKPLDRLWSFVKSNPNQLLPRLREALRTDGGPTPFFYFDGTRLLLSLSADKEDKNLAASALAKSDPESVTPSAYVGIIHSLSSEGFDVSDAGLNILNGPDFKLRYPNMQANHRCHNIY